MIPISIYIFIFIELLFVTIADIKYRKIANIWSILNIMTFALLCVLFPQIYIFSLETFIYPLAFLGITFLFFLINIMGGGDSKFLTTFMLLIPLKLQMAVMNYLFLATIVIGSFFFIRNTIKNHQILIFSLRTKDIKGVKSCFGTKFAYAPVILLAWLWLGYEIVTPILKNYR